MWDPNIYFVDDGFEGGSSCSDYWTTLFELYADLCIKDIRMGADDLMNYFLNDPQGRLAYAPLAVSLFPIPVLIRQLLNMGFQTVSDAPHVYPCDNTEETGLVLPYLIMQSHLLEEIPRLHLPGW